MKIFDQLKQFFTPEEADVVHEASGEAGALLEKLRAVEDPEVGLDIVTMGLVRGIEVADGEGRLLLTLTTPGCPLAGEILEEIQLVIEAAGLTPALELTFEPPWSPKHIAQGGRDALER